ncbi:Yos1-like protein [Thamnocephalis sphaerospora]|uniref:Yos1-like protein n=1 Tax=Thamnocephalis sphaerospora TaxID=78915 RepID=A0A4P9XKG4_9FUNG|nr:Yos1-like protein [Thamnocephalis sphaerospora]|eukprot:RKP05740.1 Yos1-like protein [Thamnocephalis sphaerospora]
MALLSIGQIFYVILLLINSLAILNEERFLARIGWAAVPAEPGYGQGVGQAPGFKVQLINLMSAVRTLMRIPLIGVNVLIILYELILG